MPALDGLRSIAIGLVILVHLSARLVPGGQIGVDIFFVLSGYLITAVLAKEIQVSGRLSLINFYIRRVLRLMPALVTVVVAVTAYEAVFGGPDPNFRATGLAAVLYLMDIVQAFTSYAHWSALSHTWSLAVEEHFYLIWPPVMMLMIGFPGQVRLKIISGLWVCLVAWRLYLVAKGASFERTYFSFDARGDELLAGCILALTVLGDHASAVRNQLARLWPIALTAILAMALFNHGLSPLSRGVMPVIAAACSCVLILALLDPTTRLQRVAATPALVAIGQISYSIYLWHWPLLIEVRYHTSSQVAALAAIAASLCIAALSFFFVEKPILRLKRRFECRGGERLVETEPRAVASA